MHLTPEQREQLQHARDNGERRVTMKFSTDQSKSWREAVDQELADKSANIAHLRKIKEAAEQPGFFGDLRRAIIISRGSVSEVAAAIGVDTKLLSDFRAGDAELPPAVLERLVETLGLRLMQEIPR